jgi:hypothetical protein
MTEKIDFSALEVPSYVPHTAESLLAENDANITLEAIAMGHKIRAVDGGSSPHEILTVFSDANELTKWIILYGAMTRVFKEHHVLDAYYGPDKYRYIAREPVHEHANGWRLNLLRPDGRGTFEVSFVEYEYTARVGSDAKKPVYRQTVLYKGAK